MLELMEGGIVVFVDRDEFLLQSFQLVFVLGVILDAGIQLLLQFVEIGGAALDIFLGLKKVDLLFLVVRLHLFSKSIFAILQHFYEDFKLLIQFRHCALFLTL